MNEKQICNIQQSLNYRLLTWNRHIHKECGGIPLPTWDRGVQYNIRANYKNQLKKALLITIMYLDRF